MARKLRADDDWPDLSRHSWHGTDDYTNTRGIMGVGTAGGDDEYGSRPLLYGPDGVVVVAETTHQRIGFDRCDSWRVGGGH